MRVLILACALQALRVLHELGADLGARNKAGLTPAMVAAESGNLDSLRLLVEMTPDLHDDSAAALAASAALAGRISILRFLETDLRAAFKKDDGAARGVEGGWTPLVAAVWGGHSDCAELLLAIGGSSLAERETTGHRNEVPPGSTAVFVAEMKGHSDLVELINACLSGQATGSQDRAGLPAKYASLTAPLTPEAETCLSPKAV